MANKYRGDVEFTDSDGKSYVLRMGLNQYIETKKKLVGLETDEWLRTYFHAALVHGAESQKELTIEQAGEIIDDIGLKRADDLIKETKYAKDSDQAIQIERGRRAEAEAEAAQTLAAKVVLLRKGVTDQTVLDAIDQVLGKVHEMEAAAVKAAGTGNPPAAATNSPS